MVGMSASSAATDAPSRIEAGGPYRDVGVFLAVVFTLPWLLWIVEQLTGIRILFFAAMIAVAIATFVAVRWVTGSASGPR